MKKYLFFPFSFILGALAACIVWLFLFCIEFSYELIWVELVQKSGISFLPIIICAVGGLFIGLLEKKTRQRLPDLEEVIEEISTKKRLNYKRIPVTVLRAFLPLAFGGSIGPEAGLTNIIAEICSWIGDRFKMAKNQMDNFAEIGASAALTAIFGAPLYGLVLPFTNEEKKETTLSDGRKPSKRIKILIYITAIVGGFSVMLLLSYFFGGMEGLPRFERISWHPFDFLKTIPLSLAGMLAGWIFLGFNKITKKTSTLFGENVLIRAILCGIVLGAIGIAVPYSMFSGETQLGELMSSWGSMAGIFLILTGIAKLFVTPLCINFGWVGGSIFPIIFAGVSIGYGISALTSLDPILCATVFTASICSAVMRKPVIVIAILFLVFPLRDIPFLIISAFLAYIIPLPFFLKEKKAS